MAENTITPLHGEDHAPTRIERELFDRAMAKLMPAYPDALPQRVLVEELVALGVPTRRRAKQVIEAHFAPGGLPPLDVGGVPSVQWLIQKHWELPTMELFALIRKHHPAIAPDEVIIELTRQADRAFGEARELERYSETRGER